MQLFLTNQATMMTAISEIQNHLGLNKNGEDKSSSSAGGGDENGEQTKKVAASSDARPKLDGDGEKEAR